MKKILAIIFLFSCFVFAEPNEAIQARVVEVQNCIGCIDEIVRLCKANTLEPNHPCMPVGFVEPNDPNMYEGFTIQQYYALEALMEIYGKTVSLADDANVPEPAKSKICEVVGMRVIYALIKVW